MVATATTLRGSKQGASVGRKREAEPDPTTPTGQWALWLAHLLEGKDVKAVTDAIGKDRSMMFKYLRGESCPHVSVWADIAKALGLPSWRSLVPPDDFVAGLKKRRRSS